MDIIRFKRILSSKLESRIAINRYQLQNLIEEAVADSQCRCEGISDLLDQLHAGIVRFSYRKADGAIRESIGTLKESLVTRLVSGSSRSRKSPSADCIVYYDLEREDWRCFKELNFVTQL